MLAIQALVMAAVSPFAGRLSDRVDARIVASAGMVVIASALALLAFTGVDTPLSFVGAGLGLLGVGFGLFSSPNTNAVVASIDPRAYGVGSATLAAMRLLGQMLSMGLAGTILGVYLGRETMAAWPAAAVVSALRAVLVLFSVISVGAMLASLARGRTATASG